MYEWVDKVAQSTGHSILSKIFAKESSHKVKNNFDICKDVGAQTLGYMVENQVWTHLDLNQCGSTYSDPILASPSCTEKPTPCFKA